MNTTSTFSETYPDKTGIYIKGYFKKEISYKNEVNVLNSKSDNKDETIVRHIFQTPFINKSIKAKLNYTIHESDERRLTKDGILKVYNMNERIDIPVTKLLGKWNRSHIGIHLIVVDGQWRVEGEMVTNIYKSKRGLLIGFKAMLKSAFA